MDQEIEKISKKLMKELDEDRYRHTQGVMYTSAALAMRYGADLKKALLAGLLHDCAKCIPNNEKIDFCRKHVIILLRTVYPLNVHEIHLDSHIS